MIGRDELRLALLRCMSGGAAHPANHIGRDGTIDRNLQRENREHLTDAERIEASVVFTELVCAGFVTRSPMTGGFEQYVITPAGMEFLNEQGKRKFFKVHLRDVVFDPEILDKTESILANGDLDTAVFAAFKVVEERLRAKAKLDASFFGVKLVSEALKPKTGILVFPPAQTDSEHEAVHVLFLGAVGAFKNPASHRTVAYDDQQHALQTIALADLLVRYIAQFKIR